jgi:hypothetical protein
METFQGEILVSKPRKAVATLIVAPTALTVVVHWEAIITSFMALFR